MNILYLEAKLFLLFIGFIACFMALTTGIPYHVRDRAFMRRITVLEKLLGSKLRCTFFVFGSIVTICRTYRGRFARFSSQMSRGLRYAKFTLAPDRVPRQKIFLRSYPMVSQHVHQRGERLIYAIHDGFVSEPKMLEKAEAIRILDELVDAAEKCEREQG